MDELAGLSDDARKLAMERFRLLQPHLDNNSAHRLVSEYRRAGLAALVRKKRADRAAGAV